MKNFFSRYFFVFFCLFVLNTNIAFVFSVKSALAEEGKFLYDVKISALIDDIESGKVKIKHKQIEEKYAGMVGDKRKGGGVNLDLFFENRESGCLLVITGNGVESKDIVLTTMQQQPERFLIDVFEKDNIVNFTYNIPRSIRLQYGKQQKGYRIALDLPVGTKMKNFSRSKDEIAIIFSIPLFEKMWKDAKEQAEKEREEKIKQLEAQKNKSKEETTTTNKNIQQNRVNKVEKINNSPLTEIKHSSTVFGDPDVIKRIDEKIPFQKINLDKKTPIIVIDAGHGGIDPGTIGKQKVAEKTITLMYARRLKDVLTKRGFKAILTREKDRTMALEKRVQVAKDNNADVFLSLHIDAHNDSKITGTTVYQLSHIDERHPDWDRFYRKTYLPSQYENFVNNSSILDILIGLTRQSMIEKNSILTDNLLLQFKKQGICKNCRHGQRSLAVLRGLNTISVLIEIGYITNPNEEKNLLSATNVEKFANTVADTLERTFSVKQEFNIKQENKK